VFPKLYKYQLNGIADASIGMKDHLAQGVPYIADRKPLEQLTSASFGLLARLESLSKNLQLYHAEGPLNFKHQLVIEIIQVVNLLLVGDEGSKNLAHLQQPAPVFVRAGQPRDLPGCPRFRRPLKPPN
jgi:hypothetical protein